MYDKWISGTTYYYKITPTDRSGNSANKARNISTQKPSTGSICKNSAGTLTVTFNSHIYPSKIPKIESFDPANLLVVMLVMSSTKVVKYGINMANPGF